MKVLVLGGRGFIGRHIVAALQAAGASVVIGSRNLLDGKPETRAIRLQHMQQVQDWLPQIDGFDIVINCVGILRERLGESYQAIHVTAPATLAAACKTQDTRLIHISALGLSDQARSRFIRSKYQGEQMLFNSGADVVVVRPSLLDGERGYGARWIRRVAQWPIHMVMQSTGLVAPLRVNELAEAIVAICTMQNPPKAIELGGNPISMAEYLARLRSEYTDRRAFNIVVPVWVVRLVSHVLDLAHLTPLSFGHVELMRGYNIPSINMLPELLGRTPWSPGCTTKRHAAMLNPWQAWISPAADWMRSIF